MPVESHGKRNQRVARAGEHFVVDELNKRGAFAVPFAGNMPKIDVIACNADESRTIHIQVKTKRGGKNWHSSIVGCEGPVDEPKEDNTHFGVFVDLGEVGSAPRFWVVPEWWMRNDIYLHHQAYLAAHGGKRPRREDSTHHSIEESRLKQWLGRWDVLRVCTG